MNREQISRTDFPPSEAGYDRPSVDAHLEAVAALTAALEAQVKALEVERDALRRQIEDGPASEGGSPPSALPGDSVESPASAEQNVGSEVVVAEPGEPSRQDDEVSARLVATRLALEGAEREQIRQKLEKTYDLEDADSVVDDVLERLA